MHGTPDMRDTTGPAGRLTGTLLAQLFEYHGARELPARAGVSDPGLARVLDPVDTAEKAALIASLDFPDHAAGFAAFADGIGTLTPEGRDELYVRTFDFRPDTALELGWHLFGETYKRGKFLVRIREALRAHDIEEEPHLPDHLTRLLRLLDSLPQADGESLIVEVILPALSKVREALEPDTDNPYRHLVNALAGLLTDQVRDELDAVIEIQQQVVAEAGADAARAADAEAVHAERGGDHG